MSSVSTHGDRTTSSARAPGPVRDKDRIFSIDVLRGVAVLGILVINIESFSMVSQATSTPLISGGVDGVNLLIWLIGHLLAEQKFMTIFSMLFGAGILLMIGRIEAAGLSAWGLHSRRMMGLVLFGLLHAYLVWSGDILVTYGLCGLLAYFFRKLRPRALLILSFLFLAAGFAAVAGYGLLFRYGTQADLSTLHAVMPHSVSSNDEVMGLRGGWLDQMDVGADVFPG